MTLPYDIARCAGERGHHGGMVRQRADCARQIYSNPEHVHPYRQSWMEPHSYANDEACPSYIAPQPAKITP